MQQQTQLIREISSQSTPAEQRPHRQRELKNKRVWDFIFKFYLLFFCLSFEYIYIVLLNN